MLTAGSISPEFIETNVIPVRCFTPFNMTGHFKDRIVIIVMLTVGKHLAVDTAPYMA
jgi:hypothetical protein